MSANEDARAEVQPCLDRVVRSTRGRLAADRAKEPRFRQSGAFLLGLISAPVMALLIGFFVFAGNVERAEPSLRGHADGVVALTGGAERISDAIELLAQGHAGRLLITGVNQSTKGASIARLTPQYRNLFDCCIDLGYEAANTLGNATETRRWVAFHGIRSLIVVTSNYHMPRALIEMGNALPGVQLIPYPVVTDRQKTGPWWVDPGMTKLLAFEYVKYLVALARTTVAPEPDSGAVGTASTAREKL